MFIIIGFGHMEPDCRQAGSLVKILVDLNFGYGSFHTYAFVLRDREFKFIFFYYHYVKKNVI